MESSGDEVIAKIAGSVVVSSNPGLVLKNWRERLQVKQILLAKEMKVSPSVLSDYESGRRSSPGVGFLKRYIEALVNLDHFHNRLLDRLVQTTDKSAILGIGEFKGPVKARQMAEMLNADILVGENFLEAAILGYTILDSIRAIYSLSGFDFYRIFGATTERVLIFTKVGMGRSPLVAIRVSQLKPRMVVLHGPKSVDPLAVDLAKKENIILALSSAPNEENLQEALSTL